MRANLHVEMRERDVYEAWNVHLLRRLRTARDATRLRPTLRGILRAEREMHCP